MGGEGGEGVEVQEQAVASLRCVGLGKLRVRVGALKDGGWTWKYVRMLKTVNRIFKTKIRYMYSAYRRNRLYQKFQPPQTDPRGGHCVVLEEQEAHNQLCFH